MAVVSLIDRSFREKIVLVGVVIPPATTAEVEESLDELALLVDTAGADVVARVMQRREAPDPATYVGSGKAEELRQVSEQVDSDTVVFDDELSPAQQFKLEKILGRTAIDRTAVILDIFGQNARTQEGMAQVALAQLRYRLPRLRGYGQKLSQQMGGVGTRSGPGETQFEIDRRRVTRRIQKLERELKAIGATRRTQRKGRARSGIHQVAIVGYTNAGKSTLLNALTGADAHVEDRLFATLDPATRRYALPGGEPVVLTDTVGFVRKLPHELVEAFKSTLEVVTEADLLVHVVDGTAADPEGNIVAVHQVLQEIGAGDVPELLAVNKSDRDGEGVADVARRLGGIPVSARTGEGLDVLVRTIGDRLHALSTVVDLLIPFGRGDVLAAAHREGEVIEEQAGEGGMHVRARLEPGAAARLAEFAVSET
jgi:GTP-binding protein HflX